MAQNGRQAVAGSSLRVDMAPSRLKEAIISGVWKASLPPAIMTSTSPRCKRRMASPREVMPVAQALMRESTGPVTPSLMAM